MYNRLPIRLQRFVLTVSHQRFLVGVVGIGVDEQGRFLLAQHRFGASGWRLLGGFMSRGESGPDTLIRELREETGLVIEVGPLFGFTNHGRWAHVEAVYAFRFAGALPSIPNGELLAMELFLPAALPPMHPDHRAQMDEYGPAALAWARS